MICCNVWERKWLHHLFARSFVPMCDHIKRMRNDSTMMSCDHSNRSSLEVVKCRSTSALNETLIRFFTAINTIVSDEFHGLNNYDGKKISLGWFISFVNNHWKENIERKRTRKKHIRLYFFLFLSLSFFFSAYNQSCVKRATSLILYHHHRHSHWPYRTNRNQHTHIYISHLFFFLSLVFEIYILSHSRWKTNRTHHNYTDPIISCATSIDEY